MPASSTDVHELAPEWIAAAPPRPSLALTDYEVEILQRFVSVRSWSSIAAEFGRSRSTVRGPYVNAMRKIRLECEDCELEAER